MLSYLILICNEYIVLGFIPSTGGQTSDQPLAILDFIRFVN